MSIALPFVFRNGLAFACRLRRSLPPFLSARAISLTRPISVQYALGAMPPVTLLPNYRLEYNDIRAAFLCFDERAAAAPALSIICRAHNRFAHYYILIAFAPKRRKTL